MKGLLLRVWCWVAHSWLNNGWGQPPVYGDVFCNRCGRRWLVG